MLELSKFGTFECSTLTYNGKMLSHFHFLFLHKLLWNQTFTIYAKLFAVFVANQSISIYTAITWEFALESWWKEDSKTLPTMEHHIKLKVLEPSKKSLIFMRHPVDKIALQLAMISVCQKRRLKFSNANFSAPNSSNWKISVPIT